MGEESQQVHLIHLPFFLLQKGIDAFPHRHHRRILSFSRQRIHIGRHHTHFTVQHLLCLSTDSLQIRSQQGIHAGDAQHDHLRLRFAHRQDFFNGLGNLRQMSSGDDVRFIHLEKKHPMAVSPFVRQNRGISSAAGRRDQKHDGFRNHQTGPFHSESLGARRVVGQGGR